MHGYSAHAVANIRFILEWGEIRAAVVMDNWLLLAADDVFEEIQVLAKSEARSPCAPLRIDVESGKRKRDNDRQCRLPHVLLTEHE